jgi:putative membrane-bound dehydrogenase-like protein
LFEVLPMRTSRVPFLVIAVSLLSTATAAAQGFSPEDAVKRMQVADGLEISLIAAEPVIRQPVTISFDERGRIWVIQYLQYPNPAGLKPVHVDQWLRTKYDKVPLPPPHGPNGADRITILESPDQNGRFRKSKDFVTGLNLASGMCIGHGGIYVVQPPYLLFYPDRNGDDIPDDDPEILLQGFGMEDAHAFANSLQWGPDGWLYGAQGSTVYANIRGVEFSQGIWRYHPLTKKFELFAEGGGNTWGLDFDRHGNVIAGTNFGGNAMLHQVQGAYYVKNFQKHGELKNPHAYGYFGHVPYTGFKGGHVTCGGIVYQGDTLPAKYRNQYIAANLLSNAIYWHTLEPRGSSFVSRFGGDLLVANDTWFRPVDCLTGPDGAVYIADWYDKRATHLDPIDNWDRTNGRIYKIQAKGAKVPPAFNLAEMTSAELVKLLGHPNDWYSREARRILAERRDKSVLAELRRLIAENKGQLALEALWALYVSGGFNDELACQLLDHANEEVRAWTVRLLGDECKVSARVRDRLVQAAKTDPSPQVRSQLACSARRLPGEDCLAIVAELLRRGLDADDAHIPLLLWWAVEARAITHRDVVLSMLTQASLWESPLVRKTLLERLARRYLAEGGEADVLACFELLHKAPTDGDRIRLVAGMDKALEGRSLPMVAQPLRDAVAVLRKKLPGDQTLLRLALRLGDQGAHDEALERVTDAKRPEAERLRLLEVLGQLGRPDDLAPLLNLLKQASTDTLRGAALTALQSYAKDDVYQTVLTLYPKWSPGLRAKARTMLTSRPASALLLLQTIDAGKIAAKEIELEQLRRILLHKDTALEKLVEKHWGKVAPATGGEKLTRIRNVLAVLQKAKGDLTRGKALFTEHCATCHTLFGQGNKIGPDLTSADRKNREFLVTNIVDPSAVIRPEFTAYNLLTTDGRILTGLIVESTPQAVTLLDAKNERTVMPRDKIDTLKASPVSLMPEQLLDGLTDQQICDLFSYLQSDGSPASGVAPGKMTQMAFPTVGDSASISRSKSAITGRQIESGDK